MVGFSIQVNEKTNHKFLVTGYGIFERPRNSPIKMASGVQDITCVFVEVAGSYEKKL